MTSAWEQFFRQQKELERLLGCMRPQFEILQGLSNPLLMHFDALERFGTNFALPTSHLEMLQSVEASLRLRPELQTLRNLVGLEMPVVRGMQERLAQIDRIAQQLHAGSSFDLVQRMTKALAPTEALLRNQRMPGPLLEASLQPHRAFQEFAQTQLGIATALEGIIRDNRILAVNTGADLLDALHPSLNLASDWWPKLAAPHFDGLPPVNVFHGIATQLDDLDLKEDDLDVEAAVREGPPARVLELGGQIVLLVYNINAEAEREGGTTVFKPTNKGMRATSIISSHLASDEQSFGVIIDHLFFLLYEGSGSAKRLISRASDTDLGPLWTLKHLRLSDRHDLEHGSDPKIQKKHQQTGDAFRGLIGTSIPKSPANWASAQVELYLRLLAMLERLWYGPEQ